ncbi:MAG: YbaB/EbfC family nucleoid-associated protein [Kiritimatiellae bacterium]|nr:YbaB/EbfC family nucleoid-associated protein [Kiritimatiellia bacterium]
MGIFDQMKQAMQMRSEMKRIQAEVEKITANYANGGISVTVRGDLTVQSIKIAPETWAEVQKGKTERFETMLLNVVNGAIKTVKKTTQEHMAQMMQAGGGGSGALGALMGK